MLENVLEEKKQNVYPNNYLIKSFQQFKEKTSKQLQKDKLRIYELENKISHLEKEENLSSSQIFTNYPQEKEEIIKENISLKYLQETEKIQFIFQIQQLEENIEKANIQNSELKKELINLKEVQNLQEHEIQQNKVINLDERENELEQIIKEQKQIIEKQQNQIKLQEYKYNEQKNLEYQALINEKETIHNKLQKQFQIERNKYKKLEEQINQQEEKYFNDLENVINQLQKQHQEISQKNELIVKLQEQLEERENEVNKYKNSLIELEKSFNIGLEKGFDQKNKEIEDLKSQIFLKENDFMSNSRLSQSQHFQNKLTLKEEILQEDDEFFEQYDQITQKSAKNSQQKFFNFNSTLFSPKMATNFSFNKSQIKFDIPVNQKNDNNSNMVERLIEKLKMVETKWMEENNTLREELYRVINICAKTKVEQAELNSEFEVFRMMTGQLLKSVNDKQKKQTFLEKFKTIFF